MLIAISMDENGNNTRRLSEANLVVHTIDASPSMGWSGAGGVVTDYVSALLAHPKPAH